MPATAAVPFPVAAGTRLLGEVISWTCSGVSVTHPALLTALRDAGLDEHVARELAPKHAFTRACKKLCDRRIIRQVAEDEAARERPPPREDRAPRLHPSDGATGKRTLPVRSWAFLFSHWSTPSALASSALGAHPDGSPNVR